MKINFILAFFAATVLSLIGNRLAAQPAEFLTLASDLYSRPDPGCTVAQIYELVEAPTSSRSRLFGLTTEECNLGTVVANPEKFPEQYALVKEGSPIYYVTPDDPPVLILNGQKDSRVASA